MVIGSHFVPWMIRFLLRIMPTTCVLILAWSLVFSTRLISRTFSRGP